MIYLFAGDDAGKRQKVFDDFLGSVGGTSPVLFFNKNDFDEMQAESLVQGSGLFFTKSVVVFSNTFEDEKTKEFLLSRLQEMQNSPNDFVFVEGKLSKSDLDRFKKARTELNYFEATKEKKEKYNSFLIANAFGAKDKFALWYNFREALEWGVGVEEIVGVLFWKAKDMILRRDFRQLPKEYLEDFAARLAYILPESRRKNLDDEAELERFLLEAF